MTDLTIHVLTEIRDEIRKTNVRLDDHIAATEHIGRDLGARIDETNRRVDRLTDHLVATEMRIGTSLVDVGTTINDVRDMLRGQLDLRARVERCEHEIDELKRRPH